MRGQTVQGACTLLRKAPLRSRAYPWSTRRPCGPLAFRRATGGSRVQRRVWGVKRGQETIGVLSPFAPGRGDGLPRPPGGGNARPAHRQSVSPPAANRCIGGDKPSAEGKEKKSEPLYLRMACRPQTVKRKKHRLSPVRSGVTQTPFESGSYRPPCRRRWRAGCCASRRAALRSARCTAARERRACRSPSRHS